MFRNLAEKLKICAVILFFVGVVVSVVLGLPFAETSTMITVLYVIVGTFFSWLGSAIIYAIALILQRVSKTSFNINNTIEDLNPSNRDDGESNNMTDALSDKIIDEKIWNND